MAPLMRDLIAKLEAILQQHGDMGDPSHDLFHARRVYRTACFLGTEEARQNGSMPDDRVLAAAAYLHDLVNLPKNHPDRAMASRHSAEAARPHLAALGFDPATISAVNHAIIAHSYSAGIPPQSLEAKLIQDADRLEALGAIGLARTFHIAGQMNRPLFDGGDPFAASRSLDDQRYALDHFAIKLLRLSATMQTQSGQRMAAQRAQFLRDFLEQLADELAVPCPNSPPWA